MRIAQPCHGDGNGLLKVVVLEVLKVVLPHDVWTGERTEKLSENGEHGRRTCPAGHHGVGHFGEAVSGLTSNLKINKILKPRD